MTITAYRVTNEGRLAAADASVLSAAWLTDATVRWVDIAAASEEELLQVLRPLNLRPAILDALTGRECLAASHHF